jgi:glucokinase
MTAHYVGVDIGGTKIGVACGDDRGTISYQDAFPTDHAKSPEVLIDDALARLSNSGHLDGAAAVGFSCPGPMSSHEGRFLDPPNMPRWHGFQLLEHVRDRVLQPVAMMNDANACALAEWHWGAGRGTATMIFMTMSTGMGAGLMINGQLHQGPDDLAGEIGHLRLDPDGPVGFGKRGSVEGYLSGPGLVQLGEAETRAAGQVGEPTVLPVTGLTSEVLCAAAADGDDAALRAVRRSADALGRLCALLTDLLNPDVIVLGTIGTAYQSLFIPQATRVLEREALSRSAARVRIVPSALGEKRSSLSAVAVAIHSRQAQG